MITLILISIVSLIIVEDLDPFNWFRNKLQLGKTRYLKSKVRIIDLMFYSVHKIFNCAPCLSFWITIGLYHNTIISGLIYSIVVYFITKVLYKYVWSISI